MSFCGPISCKSFETGQNMNMALVRNSIFFFTLVLAVSGVHAASRIYKSVDAEGNVIFTDVPPTNGEQKAVVELNETNQFDGPAPRSEQTGSRGNRRDQTSDLDTTEEEAEPPIYEVLQVTSPKHDLAIRENSGSVSITVSLTPELSNEHGHALEILMDGETLANAAMTSVDLANVDRGTHNISARVIDEEGRTLITSETVSFHMLRYSKKQSPARPSP
ncbi:MAG: hypothetical protein ACI9ON_002975 [Limisphaerales bacterium]